MSDRRKEIRSLLAIITLLAVMGLLVTASAGCSSRSVTGEGWLHEITTEGNVKTVRTLGGSVWGGTARLVEEASIGVVDGEDVYILGEVEGIAVGHDLIYVLDTQIPTVRVYDFQGRYIRDIGRKGDGPGEFQEPESIALHPHDGRLFVRDGGGGRINVYSSDGEPLARWPIRSGFHTSTPFLMTYEGDLYTLVITNFGVDVTEWQSGMIGCGPQGAEVDTIHAPVFDFKPWNIVGRSENSTSVNNVPFSPNVTWVMAPDRLMIGGISDNYRFEVRRVDGSVTVIEKNWEPVPVLPEEANWHERAATANMVRQFPGWAWNGPAIPGHKPAFYRLLADLSGRIWVLRPGPGQRQEGGVEDPLEDPQWWRNPYWIDTQTLEVFEIEGQYLGEVEMPEGLSFSPRPHVEGDMFVGYVEDGEGVPYVKRFRLLLPDCQ